MIGDTILVLGAALMMAGAFLSVRTAQAQGKIELWGRSYSEDELRDHIGDIAQVGGIRRIVLDEGKSEGVRAAEIRTGTGFRFQVLFDRAMDISQAEYRGIPLSWHCPVGITHPAYYESYKGEWLYTFSGEFLVTCGLRQFGDPNVDEGEELGQHGRISNTPAEHVSVDGSWINGKYVMTARGKMRQARVNNEHLILTRTVQSVLGQDSFIIHDIVENNGFRTEPLMFLYHINLGFPILDEGSEVLIPSQKTTCLTPELEGFNWRKPTGPQETFTGGVFVHETASDADGWVPVALVNRQMNGGEGFGIYYKYKREELPYLFQWLMLVRRAYVVGLEPGNAGIMGGRAAAREQGTLQEIQPGEKREFHLEVGILKNNKEIEAFEKMVQGLR